MNLFWECLSRWPRDLRRGSVVAHLLRLWARISQGVGGGGCLSLMSIVCVLDRSLCVGLITRPEESYRV